MATILDATSLNSGLLACCRLGRQQSDLRVSFSLDVAVVALLYTEGPFVPFPMSYYPLCLLIPNIQFDPPPPPGDK